MVSFCWKILVLGLLPTFTHALAVMTTSQYGSTAFPITLPSLAQGSTRIFVGIVESVEPVLPDPDVTVTLTVNHVLKGHLVANSRVSFRFAYPLAQAVKAGDRVLWFLPADSPGGFSIPLGYSSGDFRVDGAGDTYSSNFNRNLWDSEAELWESGECSRQRFIDILEGGGTSGSKELRYLRWADSPYNARIFPLSFLTAAVLSCLSVADYQFYLNLSQPRAASYVSVRFH